MPKMIAPYIEGSVGKHWTGSVFTCWAVLVLGLSFLSLLPRAEGSEVVAMAAASVASVET